MIFELYGPSDDLNTDERAAQWNRHLRRTIIPNNAEIVSALAKNVTLLDSDEQRIAQIFAIHRDELEARHLLGDWTAGSQRFPTEMNHILQERD
ncbi:hypothetical protein [Arthrobacter ginkgonis]